MSRSQQGAASDAANHPPLASFRDDTPRWIRGLRGLQNLMQSLPEPPFVGFVSVVPHHYS